MPLFMCVVYSTHIPLPWFFSFREHRLPLGEIIVDRFLVYIILLSMVEGIVSELEKDKEILNKLS